jgi:exosortase
MATTPETPPPASEADGPSASPRRGPALLGLLRAAWETSDGRWRLAGAGVAAGMLGIIFSSNLNHFLISWSTDENYSHGFLVPLISLYFANLAAERGSVVARGGVRLGSALLVSALLVKLATEVIAVGTLGDLALLVAIAGVVSMLGGVRLLTRYWFAIAFLVFMVPLPVALYTLVASPLQLLVSHAASVVLNATGVPVLTVGNMMTLPGGVQMFVAEACSGMRQLTGFLALTAAVAYLTRRPSWYRGAVVVASVPIAITANIARVTLTGYIMYFVNPEYASGTFHTVEGLLMLGLGLSLLRVFCWLLDQVLELSGGSGPPAPKPLLETAAPRKTPPQTARGGTGRLSMPSSPASASG